MRGVASLRVPLKAVAIALCCAGLASAGKPGSDGGPTGSLVVPKPVACGPNDKPEAALQGQVPAAMRASGFKGFNCNLELVGQFKGNGANWQTTQFKQEVAGGGTRLCGYHGTASPRLSLPGRTQFGVPVLDLTNKRNPTPSAYLTTVSMLDPWESLKVNERRQLL